MLNIWLSKRSERKRRNPIVLPLETLTHVLHYFPRKQLVNQICRVNSRFFHVANQLLPNLHIINNNHIGYWPLIEFTYFPKKLNIQTFKAVILWNGLENHNIFVRILYIFGQENPGIFGGIMDLIKPYGWFDAGKLLKNFPRPYIRFPSFEIRGIPDEALLKFLRRAKPNFINCRLSFTERSIPDETFILKVRELLTDTFLNASEILIITLYRGMPVYYGPERYFDTYGLKNCDKVAAWYRYDTQSIESFKEWLAWKQDQPESRRHLVLYHYTHSLELVEDLKQDFQTATRPLNYVVTFMSCHVGDLRSFDCTYFHPGEFHLDNQSTGERLSMFQHKGSAWRLWRRSVKPDDSTWLTALTERDAPDRIVPDGFDKEFYDIVYVVLYG
ncbi:hypothetical protein DdX_02738 [Ditylenchus destructor]|uniref:F-box domain-containing protein n=1 Tax=Ditylenchus destructor TaxID=166010 RepID=A0AAD4R9E5_9BILA|nr:hypothetical protein DdX_02738 [Ditylenchus destructor]